MKNLKTFATDEQALAYGENNLGKQQTENILVNGEPVLLCGTPQVEDIVTNIMVPALLKTIKTINGQDFDLYDVLDDGDTCATLVNAYEDCLKSLCGQRVLFVTTEF